MSQKNRRPVAQLAEQRSPKPQVGGSMPSWPAMRRLWRTGQAVKQEVGRMHWPTRQETIQTTVATLGMVLVMGLILWSADFLLIRAVKWLTGHWGV